MAEQPTLATEADGSLETHRNRRIAAELYGAYHCCKKWMHNMRSSPTAGRLPPSARGFG